MADEEKPLIESLTDEDIRLARDAGFDLSKYRPENVQTRQGYRQITEEDNSVDWSDYGRAVGSGAAGLVSGIGAVGEWATRGAIGGDTRRYFNEISDDLVGGMSPAASRALGSEFIADTSKGEVSVFDDFMRSMALKSVSAIPSVVASVLPGGIVGAALRSGGAALGTSIAAAGATARVAGGVMNAGDVTNQIYQHIDKMSDAELQAKVPVYAGYRSMMSERDARARYMQEVAGAAPIAAFAITAATGGVETQIAKRLGGEAAKGFLKGVGKGFAGEAVQESLESGGGELLSQLALNDAKLADMNWQKVLSKTIEGGSIGGIVGGFTGGVTNIGGGGKSEKPEDTSGGNTGTSDQTITPPKGAGTGNPPPPPANDPNIGDPNSAPSGSETEYPKKKAKSAVDINTVRARLEKKGIAFPEERLADIEQQLEDMRALPSGGERAIAFRNLLNQLYGVNAGVQVTPTSVGATEAAALTPGVVNPAVAQKVAGLEQAAPPAAAPAAPQAPTVPGPIAQKATELSGGQPTKPETPAQFDAQFEDLKAGRRKAVLVPVGAKAEAPKGYNTLSLKHRTYPKDTRGTYYFADDVDPADIKAAAKNGTLGQFLAMGPTSKEQAIADVQNGAEPLALQLVDENGTPKVQQGTSSATVQDDVSAVQENAAPGDTIEVTTPQDALDQREAAPPPPPAPPQTGRILTAEDPEIEKQIDEQLGKNLGQVRKAEKKAEKVADKIANGPANDELVGKYEKAKNPKKAAERNAREKVAKQLFDEFPPTDIEEKWDSKDKDERKAARSAIAARVANIVRRAEELIKPTGYTMPSKASPQMANELVWVLEAARLLTKVGQKGIGSTAAFSDFVGKERSYRSEDAGKAARAERREGGDIAMRQSQGDVETQADGGSIDRVDETEEGVLDRLDAQRHAETVGLDKGENESTPEGRERRLSANAEMRMKDPDAIVGYGDQGGKFKVQKRRIGPKGKKVLAPKGEDTNVVTPIDTEDKPVARVAPPAKKVDEVRVKKALRRAEAIKRYNRMVEKRAAANAKSEETPAPTKFEELKREIEARVNANNSEMRTPLEVEIERLRETYRNQGLELTDDQLRRQAVRNLAAREGDASAKKNAEESWADMFLDPSGKRSIAYVDDEIALVESPAINGKRIFVPALRDGRIARVDVDSFTNTNNTFTPEQMARMKAAKEAALKQAEAERPANAVQGLNGNWVVPTESRSLEAALKGINFDKFGPLFPLIRDRILREVKGVKIHVVSTAEMFNLAGDSGTLGLYEFSRSRQLENIFIRDDMDYERRVEAIIHEAVHALVLRAMRIDPKLHADVSRIMGEVRRHWEKNGQKITDQFPFSRYAFTDADEFISEAWGNRQFQQLLMETPIPMHLAAHLGIANWQQKSMWQGIIEFFTKTLRLPGNAVSAMEAIAKITDEAANLRPNLNLQEQDISAPLRGTSEVMGDLGDRGRAAAGKLKRGWIKFITGDQMRQQFENTVVGPALKQIWEAVAAVGPKVQQFREAGDKLAQRAIDLSNQYPEKAKTFAALAEEVRMLEVSLEGKNDFGKNESSQWQAKKRLPELQRMFNDLPPEMRQLYRDMAQFYRDAHNRVVESSVKGILTELLLKNKLSDQQVTDLTTRVLDQNMTDTDKTLLGKTVFDNLKNAREFHRVTGDYFPLMRFGDFVVTAKDSIKGAEKYNGKVDPKGDSVVFRGKTKAEARRNAQAFAEGTDLLQTGRAQTVYFDSKTGKEVTADEAKSLNDVEVAYRLKFQTNGVYFFESEKEAQTFFRTNPESHDTINAPEPRAGSGYQAQIMTGSQLSSLEKEVNSRTDLSDAQKALMVSIIKQASVRMLSGNKLATRRLKSQKVTGASGDFARALVSYNNAQSRHIATAESMPVVRQGLNAMDAALANYQGYDRGALVAVRDEVKARVDQGIYEPNEPNVIVKHLLSVSFLTRLFSPMYSVMNAMQPTMVTLPILGARFGNGRAIKALGAAYSSIGLSDAALSGFMNTFRAADPRNFAKAGLLGTDDIIGNIRKKVSGDKDLTAMFDRLIEQGAIDVNAGMELNSAFADGSGVVGKTIASTDRIARQMPQMVEAINRTVTAIASYRLARESGMNHEKATQYALDTVKNTQGDYSGSNAPRFFNNTWLRPAMQFRKYAQMMTYLLVDSASRSFNSNLTPEERRVAQKELLNFVGVQMMMAGALSLPGLELLKAGFMITALLGLTDGWDDQEEKLRKMLEQAIGKKPAELISSGILSRLLNIDLSQRASLADMWLFGEPKKYDDEGTQAYVMRLIAGSAGSYVFDAVGGFRQIVEKGEVAKGLGRILPIKAAADMSKSIAQYNKGEIGAGTVVVNTLGARTGSQAERGREIGNSIKAREKREAERKRLANEFYSAKNKGERVRAAARNKEWNRQLAPNEWRLRLPTKVDGATNAR